MKKHFTLNFRKIWLAIAVFSLISLIFLPSDAGPENPLRSILLVANIVMFIFSLPCGLFGVPVVILATYYLDMSPDSIRGIYLNTILFSVLGFVQWFWIARFWWPTEPQFQMLNLLDGKPKL